jgi:hypothetical protein
LPPPVAATSAFCWGLTRNLLPWLPCPLP